MVYSASNYWFGLVSDVAGAIGFLIYGARHFSGSKTNGGLLVAVGFTVWGFLEYALHRWLLHGRPSMARRGHARHHADGAALISSPALVVMAAALGVWAALSIVFQAGGACLIVFGLYAGYNHYALLHHVQHRPPANLTFLARRARGHRIHHERHFVNYGVTTTLWDRLLGTFQRPCPSPDARALEEATRSPSRDVGNC